MKYILFILPVFAVLRLHAQDNYLNVTNAIPPSPTSASLGKYGDVPVSLYTGVPSISIPFYNASEGNLSVPISLSYHSQGFRVEEMASDVGLGWSLNAGGVITRAVRGVPDDFNGDLWATAWPSNINNCSTDPGNAQCRFPSYGYLANASSIDVSYPLPNYYQENGTQDGEPDVFYFNFGGNSGQFVLNKDGIPKFFSKQNLEITYTRNTAGDIDKFKATDGNGIIYYFETTEVTSTVNSNISYASVVNVGFDGWENYYIDESDNSFMSYNTFLSPFISSWKLTKIKTPNETHEINFTYVNETQQYKNGFSQQYSQGGVNNSFSANCSFSSIVLKKVSEITWSQGKITFVYNHHRQDIGCNLIGGSSYVPNYALTSINIFDVSNTMIKKYSLDYDYFGLAPFANPTQNNASNFECNSRKLKLLSVKEFNSLNNAFNPPHVFDYNTTIALKPTYTCAKDFFGFQKQTTPTPYSSRRPKVYYRTTSDYVNVFKSRYSVYPAPTGTNWTCGEYDISPEVASQTAFILNKITYPTGGYTLFEFEPHQFELFGVNRVGGGARIKKITDCDGINTTNNIIKNYSYSQEVNPGLSSGVVMSLPTMAKRVEGYPNSGYTIFSNSASGFGSTFGSTVGYARVAVEFNGNGKTVSVFNTQGAVGVATEECVGNDCIYISTGSYFVDNGYANEDNFPFGENPNFDWVRGALMESKVYNNANQLVTKTVNEYTIKNYEKIKAIKVGLARSYPLTYKYAPYYFLSGWKVLSKQTTTNYDVLNPGKQMQSATNYNYDNADHMQVTKTTYTNSKGQVYESIAKRSKDFTSANGMINDLNTQHRFNEVIESQTWLAGSPKKLLSANFNTYFDFKTQNGLSVLQNNVQQQYQIENQDPIPFPNFQPTWFNAGVPQLDPLYKPQAIYNYDSKDNLIKQSVINGVLKNNSTNIFGHSNSLLIAQINNASEADCGFTSFESDDINLWPNTGLLLTNGHCGAKSANVTPSNYGPIRNFFPSTEAQNKKFIFSCWIKTNSNVAGTIGQLSMHTIQNATNFNLYPNVPIAYQSFPLTNTNNQWKYVEVEIDLGLIKTTGGLPASSAIGVRAFLQNTSPTINIQMDDVRFYPKEARMQTYTYIPMIGASSVSDENNNCQFYEYNTFGRLKLVKDQFGRILEKTEYNYKP